MPSRTEPQPTTPRPADRVLTIPNALSVARLLGVPLFLWVLLGPEADGWALAILVVVGVTDYLDGKIARALNQTSRLGTLLDPAADRLYVLSTLVAFVARDIIPLWLAAALLGRDLILGLCLLLLRHRGYSPLSVHHLGKAATFALMYAFPCLLLAAGHGTLSDLVGPVAWAFTIWGTALYLLAGVLYVAQTATLALDRRGQPA